jgi:hypothetical protein
MTNTRMAQTVVVVVGITLVMASILGCSLTSFIASPTETPTPTRTPKPTFTSTPTYTATPVYTPTPTRGHRHPDRHSGAAHANPAPRDTDAHPPSRHSDPQGANGHSKTEL